MPKDRGSLVMQRKFGEGIKIGDEIEIRILSVRNGKVYIIVQAPKATKVLRLPRDKDWIRKDEH